MTTKKVGKVITALRKKAGYTQKELANKLYISDKAVSKWERGLSYPDVSYLRKLSVLLDTDIETLLIGKESFEDKKWVGMICLEDRTDEIDLCSMVYDKPLVYIFMGYFLLAGISDLVIVCSEKEEMFIRDLMKKDRLSFLDISFFRKDGQNSLKKLFSQMEDRLAGKNLMVIFERYFIYGMGLSSLIQKALDKNGEATILAMPRTQEENRRQIRFDEEMVLTVNDDYIDTQYNYCYAPLLFCAYEKLMLDLSSFRELIERDAIRPVHVETANRGYVELYIEDRNDLMDASNLMASIQRISGFDLYDLKEIALQRLLLQEGE